MVVQEHTLLIVNGALNIHSGTKEILEKYGIDYIHLKREKLIYLKFQKEKLK